MMTDEQALDELTEIASRLDVADDEAAPSNEELRALATRIRNASEAL
jgi:hypothetical protein